MTQKLCEVCEEWVDVDDDGNAAPCGFPTCPQGVSRDEGDPQELDFTEE